MKIWIFILLLYSTSVLSRPTNIEKDPNEGRETLPNVSVPSIDFQNNSLETTKALAETYFEKRVVHRPRVEVNQYLGDLITSFSIALPKGFHSLSTLSFKYNSSQFLNHGYGIGISLDYPKIDKDHFSGELKIMSSEHQGELVMRPDLSLMAKERIDRICKILGSSSENFNKEFYLNRSGEDSSLYLKIFNANLVKYAQIKNNGETWIFDEEGMPERVLPLKQKGLKISSNNGILSKIVDLDSEWVAEFNYLEDRKVFRSYNGQFRESIVGLKNIEISQGAKSLSYDFKYIDEYLVKVSEKNSLKVLFAAQYKYPEGNSYAIKQEMTDIEKSIGSVIGYDAYLNKVKWHKSNANEMEFYVDLNGDFYLDKVAINQAEVISKANALSKKYFPVINKRTRTYYPKQSFQDFKNELDSIDQKITISFAVNENGTIVYREDPSLKISSNAVKVFDFSPEQKNYTEETEFGSWKITYFDAGLKLSMIPKFVDVDNNGKKDLLFCDYDNDKKNQLDLSGNFKGKSQNSMVMSYYNFYANPASDSFLKNGKLKTAFLIYPDKKRLHEEYKKRTTKKLGTVFNASFLKKVDFTSSIPCNQNTITIDYNKDGISDLLTGNQVALMNESKDVIIINLNVLDLKKLILPPRPDLRISEHPVELLDLKNDGTLEFVESLGTYVDYKSRELVYLKDYISFKVRRKSPVKLLFKEYVTFGGYAEINYQYIAGSSLVESIFFSPKTTKSAAAQKARIQPSYKKVFNYEGQSFHDELNILLGHKSSKETLILGEKRSAKTTQFDQDLQDGPILFYWRARKNGRVLKQSLVDESGKNLMFLENKYLDSQFTDGNRAFSYLAESEKKTLGQGNGSLIVKNEHGQPVGDLFFSTRTTRTITPSYERVKSTQLSLNEDFYLIEKNSEQESDHFGKKLTADRLYEYSLDGQLLKSRHGEKELVFSYDSYGRIARVQGENNYECHYQYFKNTPLILKISVGDRDLSYSYEDVTNFISSHQKGKNSLYRYKWTTDEVLLEIKKNGTLFYRLTPIFAENAYSILSADVERKYSLDGFGRVVHVERKTSEGEVVEKSVILNAHDKIIKEDLTTHSARIEKQYDGLGREILQSLSGEANDEGNPFVFKKVSHYSEAGGVERLENLTAKDHLKSYTGFSEDGEINSIASPLENIHFNLNALGQIVGVREIGALYEYDLYSNIASTEGTQSEFMWPKMKQKYSPLSGELSLTSGLIKKNSDGQVILIKNNSEVSSFEQRNIYQSGNLISRSMNFSEKEINDHFDYDDEDLLLKIQSQYLKKEFEYDEFERVKNEKIEGALSELKIDMTYDSGFVTSMAPFIKKITYNEAGALSTVEFENDAYAEFQYDIFKKPIHLGFNLGYGTVQIDYNTNLGYGGQSKLYTNVEYLGLLGQKEKTYNYDKEFKLAKPAKLSKTSPGVHFLGSNLKKVLNFEFFHENDLISKIVNKEKGNFHNFVSADKKWMGLCPDNFKSLNECFIKMSNDEFISKGQYIRAIRVAGRILGVFYKSEFYPAITDHLGSVIALISPDGKKLAFERTYSEWGEKEKVIGDKELEKNIPWAYAGLIQHPFFDGEILQSETRIYIPSLGIWSSADNLVKWSPHSLKGLPGNWNPILYAGGDPVNNMDPSGHYSLAADDGAAYSLMFREELKVDNLNRWNSAEAKAYRAEALGNLGKVGLLATGGVATLVAGGPFFAAASGVAAKGMASISLIGALEFNVARVSVGAWVAKNPEKAEQYTSALASATIDIISSFDSGAKPPPSMPENSYEFWRSFYEIYEWAVE